MIKKCKIEGCHRNAWAAKLCRKHFQERHALESSLESRCCALANQFGFIAWKVTVPNVVGVPDRVFLGYGKVFFVEFKQFKKAARDNQIRRAKELQAVGASVHLDVDSIDKFKDILEAVKEQF